MRASDLRNHAKCVHAYKPQNAHWQKIHTQKERNNKKECFGESHKPCSDQPVTFTPPKFFANIIQTLNKSKGVMNVDQASNP